MGCPDRLSGFGRLSTGYRLDVFADAIFFGGRVIVRRLVCRRFVFVLSDRAARDRLHAQQALLQPHGQRFGASRDAQFGVDVAQMGFDGVGADRLSIGDEFIRFAGGQTA